MTSEPMTPLGEGASQLHELFMEYLKAGFKRTEALQLVIAVITEGFRQPPKDES